MRGILTELRLAFPVVDDPRDLHEPYLTRNLNVPGEVGAVSRETAERLPADRLDDSRAALAGVYGGPVPDAGAAGRRRPGGVAPIAAEPRRQRGFCAVSTGVGART
ncbi:hypothetical protein DDQ41_11130 [Streptomyces spongiicola]|uniref:Uncharacterized protein n=1 Tax=Streptomyces spongiicola TaxID=1690221 RepID=A0ABN5KM24_9ACTN|nr:hypothetical protein DDQ41_11130 [Streptomyces spongiicola]